MSQLPEQVYLLKRSGEWPLTIAYNAEQAARVLAEQPDTRMRCWLVNLVVVDEVELVAPVPATVRVKTAVRLPLPEVRVTDEEIAAASRPRSVI